MKNGIPAVARIERMDKTSIKDGIDLQLWEIVLKVENPDVGAREVKVKHSFEDLKIPKVGDRVNVLIDPKRPYKLMLSPNQNN